MYCRDCGKDGEMFGPSGLRSDICKRCMDTRGRVLKAVESGAMTMADFQAYQRPGLRTKRLQKLGYWSLVDTVPLKEGDLNDSPSPKGGEIRR